MTEAAAGARTFALSGDVYDRHVGRYGPALSAALLDFARLPPGGRALDAGCGPGALAAVLAERGHAVAAIDPSEQFAEACRRRVPGADVRVGARRSSRLPTTSSTPFSPSSSSTS